MVWREGLYAKLEELGFGGKTLSLIQSLYYNDQVRFIANGKLCKPIWLSRGVKQVLSTQEVDIV